jgi:hypothetical protein
VAILGEEASLLIIRKDQWAEILMRMDTFIWLLYFGRKSVKLSSVNLRRAQMNRDFYEIGNVVYLCI